MMRRLWITNKKPNNNEQKPNSNEQAPQNESGTDPSPPIEQEDDNNETEKIDEVDDKENSSEQEDINDQNQPEQVEYSNNFHQAKKDLENLYTEEVENIQKALPKFSTEIVKPNKIEHKYIQDLEKATKLLNDTDLKYQQEHGNEKFELANTFGSVVNNVLVLENHIFETLRKYYEDVAARQELLLKRYNSNIIGKISVDKFNNSINEFVSQNGLK